MVPIPPSSSTVSSLRARPAPTNCLATRPTAGTYEYLWLNDVAYYDWDTGNYATASWNTGTTVLSGSTAVTLNAGDAIPMTYLWASMNPPTFSAFSVQYPNGDVASGAFLSSFYTPPCHPNVFGAHVAPA